MLHNRARETAMVVWYENPVVWYCLITVFVGAVAFLAVFRLGKFLAQRNVLSGWGASPELFHQVLAYYEKVNFKGNFHRHLAESNRDFLQRRNEFWTTYLQVIVAVLIVIVLALLLITKTITAEAGLPILSAVAGFAISKSAASNSTASGESDRE